MTLSIINNVNKVIELHTIEDFNALVDKLEKEGRKRKRQ